MPKRGHRTGRALIEESPSDSSSSGDSFMSSLDIKFLVHVLVETIVIAVVSFYFYRKTSYLESIISSMSSEMAEMKSGMLQMSNVINNLVGEHNRISQPQAQTIRPTIPLKDISAPTPVKRIHPETHQNEAPSPKQSTNTQSDTPLDIGSILSQVMGGSGAMSKMMGGLQAAMSASEMVRDVEKEYEGSIAQDKGKEQEDMSDEENDFPASSIILEDEAEKEVQEELKRLELELEV